MNKSFVTIFYKIILLCMAVAGFSQNLNATGMFPSVNNLSEAAKARIADHVTSHNIISSASLEITPADLNKDMIDEYIIRDDHCAAQPGFCDIVILAQAEADFVVLGKFYARKIMLSSQYSNGVRDLLVYNDQNNSFKHTVVKWNSDASSYTPSKQVSQP